MEEQEKLIYQYILNYKAYRRKMISTRALITLVVTGLMAFMFLLSVVLGIFLMVSAAAIGAITILFSLHYEQTYMIFNTRFVIKNKSKRVSVPLENIMSVRYKRAFYEKDLATGTITIKAKDEKGKVKKYRMRHVFDCADGVEFLQNAIKKESADGDQG